MKSENFYVQYTLRSKCFLRRINISAKTLKEAIENVLYPISRQYVIIEGKGNLYSRFFKKISSIYHGKKIVAFTEKIKLAAKTPVKYVYNTDMSVFIK